MRTFKGRSTSRDADTAVAEIAADWPPGPDMLFVFCSTAQDPSDLVMAFKERFPDTPLTGCTTAGEHLCGEHSTGTVVATALYDSGIRWATHTVRGLADLDEARARQATDALFDQLGLERDRLDPDRYFSLLFIDGLSMAEERVAEHLAEALEGIELAGGSAGDDLKFERTWVMSDAGAHSDAAVVVLGEIDGADVRIVKHQHFVTTPQQLVITKADPATRTVLEMDGYPALEAYARALGLPEEQVTDDVTFLHPVTLLCDGELYVRSIQKVNEDRSITFYCAIEEGMVLDVGGHHDMKDSLATDLGTLRDDLGKADFVLGFNCILRALEATGAGTHPQLGAVIDEAATTMIGFDTYGEQLNGLHINQTLVAVAIKGGL